MDKGYITIIEQGLGLFIGLGKYMSERFGEDFDYEESEYYCDGYEYGYQDLQYDVDLIEGSDEDCLFCYGSCIGYSEN